MSKRERDALGRARQLAVSGSSTNGIAVVLAYESGQPSEVFRRMLEAPELAAELEELRLAGREIYREYGFRASTPDAPTAASLSLYTWMSRQILGFTTAGVSGEVEDAAKKLDSMTNEQIADYFEREAARFRGQAADA